MSPGNVGFPTRRQGPPKDNYCKQLGLKDEALIKVRIPQPISGLTRCFGARHWAGGVGGKLFSLAGHRNWKWPCRKFERRRVGQILPSGSLAKSATKAVVEFSIRLLLTAMQNRRFMSRALLARFMNRRSLYVANCAIRLSSGFFLLLVLSPPSPLRSCNSTPRRHGQHSLRPRSRTAAILTHSTERCYGGFHLTQLTLQTSLFCY